MVGATGRVSVDVWVDVQCSWCYLNSHRLEAAVNQSGVPVEIRYRFFELGPDSPDRIDKERFLREERGMDEETLRQGQAHLNELGSRYGISYDWDRMLPTNSRRVHRLLAWAQAVGRRSETLDRVSVPTSLKGPILRQLTSSLNWRPTRDSTPWSRAKSWVPRSTTSNSHWTGRRRWVWE